MMFFENPISNATLSSNDEIDILQILVHDPRADYKVFEYLIMISFYQEHICQKTDTRMMLRKVSRKIKVPENSSIPTRSKLKWIWMITSHTIFEQLDVLTYPILTLRSRDAVPTVATSSVWKRDEAWWLNPRAAAQITTLCNTDISKSTSPLPISWIRKPIRWSFLARHLILLFWAFLRHSYQYSNRHAWSLWPCRNLTKVFTFSMILLSLRQLLCVWLIFRTL